MHTSTEAKLADGIAAVEPFTLPELPYSLDALAPTISEATLSFHYGKHHRSYVDNLNRLVGGTDLSELELPDLILHASKHEDLRPVFNNAAQVWNHTFYWHSLKPGGSRPSGELAKMIDRDFGSLNELTSAIHAKALSHFGSGWAWLVHDGETLHVTATSDADNPILTGQTPLLTIDVWEHAYYLDHQNRRGEYLEGVISSLLNWNHAAASLPAS